MSCLELHESALQREQGFRIHFDGSAGGAQLKLVQVDSNSRSAAFGCLSLFGMIDQHAAHRCRSNREEVVSILPVCHDSFGEAEIRLMDERRSIEGVIGSLSTQARTRYRSKPVVDSRQQGVKRIGVTVAPAPEQLGNLGCVERLAHEWRPVAREKAGPALSLVSTGPKEILHVSPWNAKMTQPQPRVSLVSTGLHSGSISESATHDANAGCFYSFLEEMLQRQGLSSPDQFLADDFRDHFGTESRDRLAFVTSLSEHLARFPAAAWTIEILVSVRDVVLCHVSTQSSLIARSAWENFVVRFDGGKMAECWRSCHESLPDVTTISGFQ